MAFHIFTGGESGVFEIDELVHLLKEENAQDLCIIQVPKEKRYVDYLVIASGRSTRHLSSLASDIKWIVCLYYILLISLSILCVCKTAYTLIILFMYM